MQLVSMGRAGPPNAVLHPGMTRMNVSQPEGRPPTPAPCGALPCLRAPCLQSADVTVTLTVNDTGAATVAPASVTFTPANYKTPQTIAVSAVDNALVDGPRSTLITAAMTSSDPAFVNATAASISVSVADNDTVSAAAAGCVDGVLDGCAWADGVGDVPASHCSRTCVHARVLNLCGALMG